MPSSEEQEQSDPFNESERPNESNSVELSPYRSNRFRRAIIAVGLFMIGICVLLIPIPYIGRIGAILYSNPLILLLLGGWYLGRSALATLAHLRHQRYHQTTTDQRPAEFFPATPSISILIPAYNEAKEIGNTIESVLALEYDGDVEIVVVDDGSTDGTWYILETLQGVYPDLRVFSQENAGSAAARNTALLHASNEVVLSLDADTVVHRSAISEIARHFTSDEVVAVGGNVSIKNMSSGGWWAKMQVFDYALAMEIGRMFQSMLGYVLCLSGAFGAFRRETLIEAGGWNENWLYSDDFEVSIRVHEYGEVKYTPKARADTVVPTSVRGWFHQRKAWAQRGVSVMLLHYKKQLDIDSGVVGLVGLPLRALLTGLIVLKAASFMIGLAVGSIPVAPSLLKLLVVALLGLTALSAIMLGVLSILEFNEKPIKYGQWILGYLLVYRPVHSLARLYGFSQALWWEITSLGGSLRSDPEEYKIEGRDSE